MINLAELRMRLCLSATFFGIIKYRKGELLTVPQVLTDLLPDAQWLIEADWKTLGSLNETEREWATSKGSVFSATSGLFTVDRAFEFPHIHLDELMENQVALEAAEKFFGFEVVGNYLKQSKPLEVEAIFENPMTMGQYCNYNTPGRYEYITNFVLNKDQGGGVFVEYHAFPHYLTPLQVDSHLMQTVGRHLGGDRFAFLNILVPYGYVMKLNPNTIHCDSGNAGVVLSAFADEPADVVFLRSKNTQGAPLKTFNPYSALSHRGAMTEMQRTLHDVQHVAKFVMKLHNTHTNIRQVTVE